MMTFLLLPYLGHAIFALFGQRYKFRKTNIEYKKKQSFNYEKLNIKTGDDSVSNILNQQSSISKRGIYSANIEVVNNAAGKPELKFYQRGLSLMEQHNIGRSMLSLSDENEYAIAFVTLVEGNL